MPSRKHRDLNSKMLDRIGVPMKFRCTELEKINEQVRPTFESYLGKIRIAIRSGHGMYICGENGSGKTSAAAFVLMEARREGFTGYFTTANQLVNDVICKSRFDDAQSIEQRSQFVDVLVIDDLGKEGYTNKKSDVISRMIENVVRARVGNMKPTIITSNISSLEEIEKRYGASFCGLFAESFLFIKILGSEPRSIAGKNLLQYGQ